MHDIKSYSYSEIRSDGVDVSSQHGMYSHGEALQHGNSFFIDEMDSGLHSYITQLIVDIFRNRRINRYNAQLIFTTHDVNLLDQNTIRKDQVWFTSKDEQQVRRRPLPASVGKAFQ